MRHNCSGLILGLLNIWDISRPSCLQAFSGVVAHLFSPCSNIDPDFVRMFSMICVGMFLSPCYTLSSHVQVLFLTLSNLCSHAFQSFSVFRLAPFGHHSGIMWSSFRNQLGKQWGIIWGSLVHLLAISSVSCAGIWVSFTNHFDMSWVCSIGK